MTETYDVEKHLKARNRMFACWVVMLVFWGMAWYESWQSAMCSMFANAYFLFSIYWFWNTYPKKSERD